MNLEDFKDWNEPSAKLPPIYKLVDGYSPLWENPDYNHNPLGVRQCMLDDKREWVSACWNKDENNFVTGLSTPVFWREIVI